MNILASLLLSACCIALSYYAAAVIVGWRFARRHRLAPLPLPEPPPQVAILKPLHGCNLSLERNLGSFFEVDYPAKRLAFAVSYRGDPACAVVENLIASHPGHEVKLEVGHLPRAAQNKVGKLVRMAERVATADVLALSDADIVVEADYLKRVVAELYADPSTGMVTCLYRAWPGSDSLGARLEAAFVNTEFLPMALLASAIEPLSYAFGATIAIKRQVLEAVGGFEGVKDLLADDFHLGNRVFRLGYSIKLSSELVTIITNERSFRDFWIHQLRWARTYRNVRPVSVAVVLTHGTFWGLLLAAASRFNPWGLGALAAMVLARYIMAGFMVRTVAGLPLRLWDLSLIPIKDLIATGVWFASLLGHTVTWADRRFRILSTGQLKEI